MRYQRHQERVRVRPRARGGHKPNDFFLHGLPDTRNQPGTCGECVYYSRNQGASSGQCDRCYQDRRVKGSDPACAAGEKKRTKQNQR